MWFNTSRQNNLAYLVIASIEVFCQTLHRLPLLVEHDYLITLYRRKDSFGSPVPHGFHPFLRFDLVYTRSDYEMELNII